MFDTSKLIQEIEKKDCLWNMNHKNYLDKTARRNAWEDICKVFHSDWNILTKKQKDERVDFFIKKWRNVRDYYMREKKRGLSPTTGIRKKKKYYYYDNLRFLDAVNNLKNKRTVRRSSDSQEIMNNTEEYLEDTSNDMISYEQCIAEQDSLSESGEYIKQEDESTSKEMPSFETHVLSLDKSQDIELNVANQNFLQSLLPDVNSLNERQNMRFRLGVLNLLNDIKYGHT